MKAGEIVEHGGKKYLVIGKTFGTKTKLSPGDRFVLEGETLNLERNDEGKVIKASVWVPEVIEATDKGADSLEAIVKRAKGHGVLQEKVRHEDGEVEYLPTDAGKPSSATKGRWVTIGGHPVYIEKSRGVPSGKVADSYMTWQSEDTITGHMVIEHKEDKAPTEEQIKLFITDNLANEIESLRGPKDVESIKILERSEGPDWVSVEVDITPTEDAGDRWLEEEGGTEEWLTYHGQSSFDEKAEAEAYPDESKKLRFVAQNHYRGKSCHLDLRFEYRRGDADYLRGWTVAHQVAGAIKAPVTAMAQAEKANANPGNWKMDLKTGEIKPRQIRGGTVRRGDLRAFQKAAEIPKDWLDVEGVTEEQDPGEKPPAGATQQFPGVFTILEKGQVEWGAQKPWFSEFFLEGKWKGRWCFRLVKREGEKFFAPETMAEYEAIKAAILPPGKEEEETRTGSYWVLMQPKDETPYVLSKEATSENWLPPKGVSCLPAKTRKSVPKELQFWTMDRKEALEARAKLAEFEELGGTELKLLVLRELTEDGKAKASGVGRWRTLPDGRQVLVTASAAERFGGGGRAPSGAGATNSRKLDGFLSENTQWGWKSATIDERADAKAKIVSDLARQSGLPADDVNRLVKQWAYSSNDDDVRSLSLQRDAAEEFALPLSDFSKDKLGHIESDFSRSDQPFREHHGELAEFGGSPFFPLDSSPNQREFLRAMYQNTQQRLREQGLKGDDTVTLYRGVRLSTSEVKSWKEGSHVPVVGNTLESWSVGSGIASVFAGEGTGGGGITSVVLAMDVPVEMIVGTAKTGFGCLSEGEVIVLGSKGGTAEVMFIKD